MFHVVFYHADFIPMPNNNHYYLGWYSMWLNHWIFLWTTQSYVTLRYIPFFVMVFTLLLPCPVEIQKDYIYTLACSVCLIKSNIWDSSAVNYLKAVRKIQTTLYCCEVLLAYKTRFVKLSCFSLNTAILQNADFNGVVKQACLFYPSFSAFKNNTKSENLLLILSC